MEPRVGFLLGLGAWLIVSCGDERRATEPLPDPFVVREIPAEIREDLGLLVAGNNDFAFRLYEQLRDENENLFVSPYSVSTALAMAWAGARGETESEMAQTLALPFEQNRLHVAFGSLQDNLQTGAGLGAYRLAIANRLWGALGRTWRPEFLEVLRESYDAPLQELDFTGQPDESRRIINLWVKERTEGRIPELLPSGAVGTATSLVVTNAIYFKGIWQHAFDLNATVSRWFAVSHTDSVLVPMMSRKADYEVAQSHDLQILAMPFRGRDLSLIVILPMRWTLQQLEDEFTPANLETWLGTLELRETVLSFPRFSYSSKFELGDVLAALGMPSAFTDAADFSGMDGTRSFHLEEVYHEAFIKIDEIGAEAAAATGGVPPPSAPILFTVDHAFLFLIYDHVTQSVLFLGRVMRPVG